MAKTYWDLAAIEVSRAAGETDCTFDLVAALGTGVRRPAGVDAA